MNEKLFDLFWKAYPKKIAKPKARIAFDKLKADEDLLTKILTALEVQKQSKNWLKDKGQFIPYPATYLNQRRWEDELDGEIVGSDATSDERYCTVL